MFGTYFHHQQMRRYIVAFGSLFNKIELRRWDSSGAETQRLVVPIDYANKEKWFTRLTQDPQFQVGIEAVLPRMAFEMPTLHYDSSRHLNTGQSLIFRAPDETVLTRMYVGVPYNLNFNLQILTKLQQDGLQIIEQILPYFTPDLFFAMIPVPAFGITETIPLTLNSVTTSDDYEGEFKRRVILWNLSFNMKVWFYGPKRDSKRITNVEVDIFNVSDEIGFEQPTFIDLESPADGILQLEDGGRFADESSPDETLEPTAIITAVADPDQDPLPSDHVAATVTVVDNG